MSFRSVANFTGQELNDAIQLRGSRISTLCHDLYAAYHVGRFICRGIKPHFVVMSGLFEVLTTDWSIPFFRSVRTNYLPETAAGFVSVYGPKVKKMILHPALAWSPAFCQDLPVVLGFIPFLHENFPGLKSLIIYIWYETNAPTGAEILQFQHVLHANGHGPFSFVVIVHDSTHHSETEYTLRGDVGLQVARQGPPSPET